MLLAINHLIDIPTLPQRPASAAAESNASTVRRRLQQLIGVGLPCRDV